MFSCMRSFIVVIGQPAVQVQLQFLNASVNFLSESYGIKLFLNRPVKTFTYTVGLKTFSLGLRVVDIFNGQIELVFILFSYSTVFGSSVC